MGILEKEEKGVLVLKREMKVCKNGGVITMNIKKILVVSSLSLLLVACSQEGKIEENKSETMFIEENMTKVYEGLLIDIESYVEKDGLKVKIVIRNTGEESIPLHYNHQDLGSLTVSSQDIVLFEEILSSNKPLLKPQEEIIIEKNFHLPDEKEEYVIKAQLNVSDTKEVKYKKEELDAIETFHIQSEQEIIFMPRKPVTYLYETKQLEETITKEEEYIHFQNGFVQSVDSSMGTKLYYIDQKGLYYAYTSEEKKKENIINHVPYNKKMILAFPAKKGAVWQTEGINYEITSDNMTLETPIGIFKNVIEVSAEFGTGMRYYYHKDVGLLQVDVKNEGKWESITKLVGR